MDILVKLVKAEIAKTKTRGTSILKLHFKAWRPQMFYVRNGKTFYHNSIESEIVDIEPSLPCLQQIWEETLKVEGKVIKAETLGKATGMEFYLTQYRESPEFKVKLTSISILKRHFLVGHYINAHNGAFIEGIDVNTEDGSYPSKADLKEFIKRTYQTKHPGEVYLINILSVSEMSPQEYQQFTRTKE